MMLLKISTLCLYATVSGFVIHPTNNILSRQINTIPTTLHLAEADDSTSDDGEKKEASGVPKSPQELLKSEAWNVIKQDMNAVPMFTCANEQGQPLQYEVNGQPVPFFYVDVDAAAKELEIAREATKLELDLVPFPLGEVFEKAMEEKALMIPSQAALMAAGAPQGVNPLGQAVPLFACMEIAQEMEDGRAVLPLFFSLPEAQSALAMAMQLDGGNPDDFEVVGLSLIECVQQLATVADSPAFQFIPPASSVEHIRKYLEG